MISYSEFQKVELKVANILNVEDIPGKDKLYKLTIDLGTEKKTIVAGVKEFYKKEDLKGKNIVIVANLEPRTIAGIKSEGMLLAAKNKEGGYSLVEIDKKVAPGTRLE
ncbi:MAG: methionine--tRNA ligase subunit beta [Candidatus Diapherotrites archaeon]